VLAPGLHNLCDVAQGFEILLVNAPHVKNVLGRKTEMKDSQWPAQLLEVELLRWLHPAGRHRRTPGDDPIPQEAHPVPDQ